MQWSRNVETKNGRQLKILDVGVKYNPYTNRYHMARLYNKW